MSLASGLCGRILSKTKGRGASRLPSKSALAKEFGVSPATVSNAIRMLKDQGAIRSVPGKGVYLASGAPAKAGSGRKRGAGLLLGLAGCYLPSGRSLEADGLTALSGNPILSGVWTAVRESGSTLAMIPGEPGLLDVPLIRRLKLDGVIVAGGMPASELEKLRRASIPAMLSNYPVSLGNPVSFVDFDNAWMLEEAVRLFKARGRRRVAFLGASAYSVPGYGDWLKERFLIALAKSGLFYDFTELFAELPMQGPAPAYEAASAMLSLPEPPDSFFCWSSSFADSVALAAKERSLRIPRDLSIAVCVNSGETRFSQFLQPCEELGRALFESLCKRIDDPGLFIAEFMKPVFQDRRTI